MYERYWGLRKSPFRQAPDVDLFFPAKSHRAALLKLRFLVEQRPGLGLLAGQGGAGKSLTIEMLRSSLADPVLGKARAEPVHSISYPYFSPLELLNDWAIRLGCQQDQRSIDGLIRVLTARLQGMASVGSPQVLVLEDAHLFEDRRLFDTIGTVLNIALNCHAPFSIILSGHPDLLGILRRQHSLDERLGMQVILEPFTKDESRQYIEHCLSTSGSTEKIFDDAAFDSIFALSLGNPRRINRLCDYALLLACADQLKTVSATQIESAGNEFSWSRAA